MGVFEDEGDALGGIGEVDGEVGAASFDDGEEADDEVDGALHAKADDDLGGDAEAAEMSGQAFGALVELAVGEAGVVADEGDGVGRAGGLPREDFVKRVVGGGGLGRRIPLHEQLAALGVGEKRDVAQGLAGIGGE